MDTKESFEISFKPVQSSPEIPQSPYDSREVQNPHPLSGSNSMLHVPTRDNNLDVILSMLQDMKMKFEQHMHQMGVKFQHVENKMKSYGNIMLNRENCSVKGKTIITAQLLLYLDPIPMPTT